MKKKFIVELKSYLQPLSAEERDAILTFYEERFDTGIRYEGKTETEIVEELETPKQIARNVLFEYGYDSEQLSRKDTQTEGINPWSILWLILFDVMVVTVIVPVLFSLFVSVGGGLITFIAAMVLGSGTISVWGVLITLGIAYLWLLVLLWIYDLLLGFVLWLMRWHFRVFQLKRYGNSLKTLKKAMFSNWIKRSEPTRRMKNVLAFCAIIAIFLGAVMSVRSVGGFAFLEEDALLTQTYEVNVLEDIQEENVWTISAAYDLGNIKIIRGNEEEISIVSKERENVPVTLTIDEAQRKIHFENTLPRSIFYFGNFWHWFLEEPSIVIEIPEDLIVETIDISGLNNSVTIDGFDLNNLSIETTNGTISLRRLIVVNDIKIITTNGTIELRDIESDTIDAKSTNGTIKLKNIDAFEYRLETTNGTIDLTNLNTNLKNGETLIAKSTNGKLELSEVYVVDIDLKTTNGDIDYSNTDLTYVLDRLRTKTTNGRVSSNVPVKP